jgi:hypothetical protein
VARLGYDPDAEESYVEFHSGALYAYRMPPKVFSEFATAQSKGTFLNEEVKPACAVRKLRSA